MKQDKKVKICFISFNSWPLFKEKSVGYFGGAEVQISLIVKELIKDKNFQVSLIVSDYGQKSVIKKNNLAIYKCLTNPLHYSLVILHLLYNLVKIKADVYVERTMNIKVGLVALFSKVFRKKFVYMVAHEWDCQLDLGGYLKNISKLMFIWGVKQADLVVAQNEIQQKKLINNFSIKAELMLSVMKVPLVKKKLKRDSILWVGRADEWKRPLSFINLAKQFPNQQFVMVCRRGEDKDYFDKVMIKANQLTNIKFFLVVPFEEINNYYRKAKVFVNTSTAEGFPNTFLQAGLSKTPVLSLSVNPDNFIKLFHCGVWAKDSQKKLESGLRKLISQPGLAKNFGKNNYEYVVDHHGLENIKIFKQALKRI